MKKHPLVSIIMNCHNGEKYLKKSLQSIKNQEYKNWELIFWDNKSSDKSKKIFSQFKDKRFKYFFSKKKTVLYKARNNAIKKTKGEFIAFLDVDDFWTKDKLTKQVPKFKDKKTGLVYSNFFKYYDKNKKKKLAFKEKLSQGNITKELLENYRIGILTVMLRKKMIIKRKKIFDYKYDLISDFDFIIFFSLNCKFACVDKPLAFYRIHNYQLQKLRMFEQAKQFCAWYTKKKIEKRFKKYNINKIKKKYYYFDLIKDIEKNKMKVFVKVFRNFNFVNILKIIAIIILPKNLLYNFIDNV
jgi:glycosyltransferase involved in cell wall biosynthesis